MVRYWDHYFPKSSPRPANGIKAKSGRGKIGKTWWSSRWIAALEQFTIPSRLQRGRSYARRGQVLDIDIEPGLVTASVQGSRRRPYDVEIALKPISDEGWEKVADVLASQAIFAAKLLAGEMPQNVEEAFDAAEVALFPVDDRDLQTDCSCPDFANPCKHIAAVHYLLAERFDEDPFLIFKLRGRDKEQIIAMLRERRVADDFSDEEGEPAEAVEEEESVPPLEERLDAFWKLGATIEDVRPVWRKPVIPAAVLKRLGDAPFSLKQKNFADVLEEKYAAVAEQTEKNLERLLEEDKKAARKK